MTLASNLKRAGRLSTAPIRGLPGLLIVGGIRCGTTSLWDWLSHHPRLAASSVKEVHYLDINPDRSPWWYRSFFDLARPNTLHFEATPSYLVTEGAARQASELMPQASIIALLRDPASRAWSHYRLRRQMDQEHRSFGQVVEDELEAGVEPLIRPEKGAPVPYLACGLYAPQLQDWRAAYGDDRLLLIDSDDMFVNPEAVLHRIQSFLQIDVVSLPAVPRNAAPQAEPDESTMAQLRQFYADSDRLLKSEFGFTPSWR